MTITTPNVREATERPAVFSGEQVLAILEGRQTVVRQVIEPQPPASSVMHRYIAEHDTPDLAHSLGWFVQDVAPLDIQALGQSQDLWPCNREDRLRCPQGLSGDRLWVQETFVDLNGDRQAISYRADDPPSGEQADGWMLPPDAAWQSPRSMPRWASRILLEVVSVRAERLQDMDDAEAVLEGVRQIDDVPAMVGSDLRPLQYFSWLWDQLNEPRGFSWKSNPWIWRVEFAVLDSTVAQDARKGTI